MSRSKAVEILESFGLSEAELPPEGTDLTFWTMAGAVGYWSSTLLSAMAELRDERWVLGSATPVLTGSDWTVGDDAMSSTGVVSVVCVFRRLSLGEDNAMRIQQQPMVVAMPPRGRAS